MKKLFGHNLVIATGLLIGASSGQAQDTQQAQNSQNKDLPKEQSYRKQTTGQTTDQMGQQDQQQKAPGQAEIKVEQQPAEVDVTTQAPEVIVRQPEPEVQIDQQQPQVTIEQQKPEVTVETSEPNVEVTREGEPQVTIENQETAGAPGSNQEEAGATGERMGTDESADLTSMTADQISGKEVLNSQGNKIGTVKSVVFERGTRELGAVIESGGFLGMGDTDFVVPLAEFSATGDRLVWEKAVTKEELDTLNDYNEERYGKVEQTDQPLNTMLGH